MSRALVGAGSVLIWLAASPPVFAVSFSLTTDEIHEAIRLGEQSLTVQEFDKEWQVVNQSGESVVVVTPFQQLAVAARRATLKGETLKPRDIETVLKRHRGRLLFRAELRGRRGDFARWYQPVLLLADRQEIKAAFVQNERTARSSGDGQYVAQCLYAFPAEGLPPMGRATLLIRDVGGQDVSRFDVDLSTMR